MQKPLILVREDFLNDMVNLINAYSTENDKQLPLFIIAEIVEGLLKEINEKSREQYSLAKSIYQKSLEKEKKEGKE